MIAYVSSLLTLVVGAIHGLPPGEHRSTCFDSVVFLTLFILAGKYLETYSKERTDDAVAALGKLRPTEAVLITSSVREREIATCIGIDFLEIGDIVSTSHGSSPPADGVIVSIGDFLFDESSLTGESRPVTKSRGDHVFAGSVNIGPPTRIRLSNVSGSSMLDQIISVVQEGQTKRAPLERVADTLTAHFVPMITLIAILTFIVWLSLGIGGALPDDYLDTYHMGWTFWSLEFAIAVFVVACPCGLALAAPTALFVGGGVAARHGILVKGGGEAFQEASNLDAVVFDKTGTLTDSSGLRVSDHEVLAYTCDELYIAWAVARQLEENSNHPIAKAIREFCPDKESPKVRILSTDIQEISGHGMQGSFTISIAFEDSEDTKTATYEAAIGNERLLDHITPSDFDNYYLSTFLSRHQALGKSIAVLSLRRVNSDESLGQTSFSPAIVFALSASIRPEGPEVISRLQKRGIHVFMCTGDNKTTAHAVADTLGIPPSNVVANVLPMEKAKFICEVQEGTFYGRKRSGGSTKRSIVAFVGDGVNDAPALAAADVSVALASGSDVAMNSASFILLNSDLRTVLQLVTLSRRIFRRVKLNFAWALIYNICLIPIAAGVFYPIVVGQTTRFVDGEPMLVDRHLRLPPVWAALAMASSSISVICSSLALGIEKRHFKRLFRWKNYYSHTSLPERSPESSVRF
jgi:heavy metal translocating P-type ATPase